VLWQPGRDIEELLIPFLATQGREVAVDEVMAVYRPVSLGRGTSRDLWAGLGLPGGHDATYLQGVTATPGLRLFLVAVREAGIPVGVLSNCIAEHSVHLRRRFGLEGLVDDWVISSDVGLRKPDPAIYQAFAARTGWPLAGCLFVDDRPANHDAARASGMATVLFGDARSDEPAGHTPAPSFEALARLLGIDLKEA